MKLVKVRQEFYDLCRFHCVDEELLFNENGRPCVLLVKLLYKGKPRDFVVPLRSNISSKTPRNQYFALPPNDNTRERCRHGIHYYKLFPIAMEYVELYRTDSNGYYSMILNILNRNESRIVRACEAYLEEYSYGNKHFITPNIDGILEMLTT